MTTTCDRLQHALTELVTALETAFISSWQSTAAWQLQLDRARNLLDELERTANDTR